MFFSSIAKETATKVKSEQSPEKKKPQQPAKEDPEPKAKTPEPKTKRRSATPKKKESSPTKETPTKRNEDQKSATGTSLSESVHLVVDETPVVESSIEKPTEEETAATTKTTESTAEKVTVDVVAKLSDEVKQEAVKENEKLVENRVEVEKTDKQVADSSPIKAEKPCQKSVHITVTVKANINTPQGQAPLPTEIKQTVLNELMNESSNTNYSMDD